MSVTFAPARRQNTRLIIGIAGPSGGGKTLSALLLAKGLSGGKPFAFVDTERGRGLHYADDFDFMYAELDEPFSPAHYTEAIVEATKFSPPVIVIDSMSHEHTGIGGVSDMHEDELTRLTKGDDRKRESYNWPAWRKPKEERKKLINDHLLRLGCHVILCFRADEKTEMVADPEKPGKKKIVPKRTLSGHVGWIPVAGKEYPYELTASIVVTPDQPGVPRPIKLMDAHKPFFPTDRPITEDAGRRLAEWAAGGKLAEPEVVTDRQGRSLTDRPEASADPHSGSASVPSTLAEFKQWRIQAGISDDQARAAATDLLGDRAPNDGDARALYERLTQVQEAMAV